MKAHGAVLYVDSLDDGVDFYKALLGKAPDLVEKGRGFAQFNLSGFELIIHETPESPDGGRLPSPPRPVLEIEVDPDESRSRLSSTSFAPDDFPTDRNYGLRQLNVTDPGGNRVAVVRPLGTAS